MFSKDKRNPVSPVSPGKSSLRVNRKRKNSWLAAEKYRLVEDVLSGMGTLADVAAANEISPQTLHGWMELARDGAILGLCRWYKDTKKENLHAEVCSHKFELEKLRHRLSEAESQIEYLQSELWPEHLLVRG